MSKDAGQRWLRTAPTVVAAVVGGALGTALVLVVAIDVFDAFGLRDAIFVQRDSDYPYAFYHLFADRHPVEWLQWHVLAAAAVALAMSAGRLWSDADPRQGWGVAGLAVAVSVLALQDAGDQRHIAADLAEGLGGATASLLAELVLVTAVGLVAVGGLVAAWPVLRQRPRVRNVFLAGYGLYGIIGLMHATSDLWYAQGGTVVLDGLLGGRVLAAPASWQPHLLPWLVMDAVVEESMELVADGLLAMGAMMLLRQALRRPTTTAAEPRLLVAARQQG